MPGTRVTRESAQAMGTRISFQISDERLEQLRETAREMDRSLEDSAAALVEEGLRQREFPGIEFRSTALGRQAYLSSLRLALWQITLAARDIAEPLAIARHLSITADEVELALTYARRFPDEIAAAIAANETAGDVLARTLPAQQVVEI